MPEAGLPERRFGGLHHARYGEFEYFATGHMHVLHPGVDRRMIYGVARSARRLIEKLRCRAVRTQLSREKTVALRAFEDDRARAIPEENCRRAILLIGDFRKRLATNEQHAIVNPRAH